MVKPHAVLRRLHPEVDMVMAAAVTDSEELGILLDQTDLVLFSRMINDGAAEILNKRGIPFGLDLDDHWWLPKHHILYEHYTKNGISQKTEQSIRDAHFVIVTTPYLAAEVEKINPNVHIIENGIDEDDEIWRPNKVQSDRLRFGFTQGNTHLEDIKSIADSVVKSYTDIAFYKRAQVVLTGFYQALPNEPTVETLYEIMLTGNYKALKYHKQYIQDLKLLIQSKEINAPYRRVWGVEVTEFAKVYDEIDVSVVPLTENLFNSCKSELKMLEAGFKDCAVMVSHVKPYDLLATDKNSFNLSTHSFYELQRIILNNPNLVADKKAQLREDVQKYSLNNLTAKRKQIYEHYIKK